MFYKFTQWFDRPPPQNSDGGRKCDYSDCEAQGVHRAPKSRRQLQNCQNEWLWFCLEHVRAYNATWNYYQGMNEAEVLQQNKEDITWQRPTWRMGADSSPPLNKRIEDPFGFFFSAKTEPTSFQEKPRYSSLETEAMALLRVSYPFTKEDLKRNYRILAKEYHPDIHQNSPEAEIEIRKINEAYTLLKKMVG
jgi:hypothetical protein